MSMFRWWTPAGRAWLLAQAEQAAKVKRLFAAVIGCLRCEGWDIQDIGGQRLRIRSNGVTYERAATWLMDCDYSDVPPALANDLLDIVRDEGFCDG